PQQPEQSQASQRRPPLAPGPGRRKSVRMLVQEQRPGRQLDARRVRNAGGASSRAPPPHSPAEQPADTATPGNGSVDPPPMHPAVVRRKSTKLWGCIPEEIRPRGRRGAIDASASPTPLADGRLMPLPVPPSPPPPPPPPPMQPNDEIVRRALSLLRKPEPNPQAEKEIVEAAIKCADASTAGSTRAQFVQSQELKRRQTAATAVLGEADNKGSSSDSIVSGSSRGRTTGGSVGDTVRALFAKYGMATAAPGGAAVGSGYGGGGIRFQWIKGKLIGKGSFGHVHVALNAGTGEVIAVKQIKLPPSLCAAASDKQQRGENGGNPLATNGNGSRNQMALLDEAIGMMYTEVELLQDLDHENIVQLLGFEAARGGVMSMFLEYVPGGTVQSLVQQHGPLPESVVHSFLRQILAGLGYLHDRGILHRDIKGANILVDETGTCKISDFGISRKADSARLANNSSSCSSEGGGSSGASSASPMQRNDEKRSRRILGTVPFMAPEVVRASEYSAGADIWSLGCVVLQMWSGRGPWDELQEPQVFFKLGKGLAPPIPDDLTEAGIDFCKSCFSADPALRHTAVALAEMEFAQVPPDYVYPYTSG
ncbi:mitogen-activated protein kinase kinase kinase, partial [Coemansia sp. Benny D160-2]